MKTVLFFIPTLGGGGAEKVLCNLVNNLDRNKYRITVQTLFNEGVNRTSLDENIEYRYCFNRIFKGNARFFTLFSPRFLYKRLIRKHYDIAISYLEGPTARIISGCPYDDTKLVNWVHREQHDIETATYSYRSCEEARKCMYRYDRTICVADSVRRDFTNLFPISHPCEVLYNTNEMDYIINASEEEISADIYSSEFNIVSIGRLVHEKGYDRLLRVLKRLLDTGLKIHIYIIGEGYQGKRLRNLAAELHIDNNFHLLGFHRNPYKYISKADLFVCSSRREGFSTAVTEALIIGLPIVSTCCSGAYELLGKHNEYGIVTGNDEDGLFQGLQLMISNPELAKHYREQAKIRGKAFSKAVTVKAVENMLDAL